MLQRTWHSFTKLVNGASCCRHCAGFKVFQVGTLFLPMNDAQAYKQISIIYKKRHERGEEGTHGEVGGELPDG